MKLGICIPYRDIGDGVRKKHLDTLVPYLEKFFAERDIDFRIYIGHQVDDKKFNRSGTKNVAFLAAKEDGCDYVAFHDVDMLPHLSKEKDNDLRPFYGTLPPCPLHVAWACEDISGKGPPYAAYVGGILALSGEQMERTNGFPNNYWGWGGEDDVLYRRVQSARIVRPTRSDFTSFI